MNGILSGHDYKGIVDPWPTLEIYRDNHDTILLNDKSNSDNNKIQQMYVRQSENYDINKF